MGEIEIPDEALWGAQTQRAVENFPISGLRFGRRFIQALGWVKWACAWSNVDLGLLERRLGEAILPGCGGGSESELGVHFPADIF